MGNESRGQAIGILNDDDSLDLFKKTALVQKNDGIRLLQGKSHKSNVRRAATMHPPLTRANSYYEYSSSLHGSD